MAEPASRSLGGISAFLVGGAEGGEFKVMKLQFLDSCLAGSVTRGDLPSAQLLWCFSDLTLYPRWPLLYRCVPERDLAPTALEFCALGLQE